MQTVFTDSGTPEHIFLKYKVNGFRRREILIASAIFLIMAGISVLRTFSLVKSSVRNKRTQVMNLAVVHGSEIQRMIEHTMLLAYTLEELVQSGNGKIAGFPAVARRLLAYYPAAANLQLAPGGVVSQIIPLEGNEKAIGHDLFHDKARVAEAEATRDSGKLTLAGPYQLIQGGTGFIGRLPVFMKTDHSDHEFWGFVNVMINFSQVTDALRLGELKTQGYAYRLSKIMAGSETKLIVASLSDSILQQPAEWNFTIANTEWTFSMEPFNGWIDIPRMVTIAVLQLFLDFFVAASVLLMLQLNSSNKKLEQLVCIDQLTKLYAKQTALSVLQQEISHAGRYGLHLAVCFIDMDNFKQINDRYGHAAGDTMLAIAADRMKSCMRAEDIVARYGGDEFLVILRSQNKSDDFREAARRLTESLRKNIDIGTGQLVKLSASVGIAVYPENGNNIEELISYADKSMYAVKRGIRNQDKE
jgi:diguanylate cyclase (GGDEF)-like protein